MRRTIILSALALMLAALPVVLAEDPEDPIVAGVAAPIPDGLEELLEAALESNPDILLAEAGVREAQAALNQRRLDVAQRVAGLYHERKKLLRLTVELKKDYERAKGLYESGVESETRLRQIAFARAEADAKLAQVEPEIRYALGIGGSPRTRIGLSFTNFATAPFEPVSPPPLTRPGLEEAPAYRHLLGTMKVEWLEVPIGQVVAHLEGASKGDLAFVLHSSIEFDEYMATLRLPGEVPLKHVLSALADYFQGELCFVFRDYGVLLTDADSARYLDGATIPEDIPLEPRYGR